MNWYYSFILPFQLSSYTRLIEFTKLMEYTSSSSQHRLTAKTHTQRDKGKVNVSKLCAVELLKFLINFYLYLFRVHQVLVNSGLGKVYSIHENFDSVSSHLICNSRERWSRRANISTMQ